MRTSVVILLAALTLSGCGGGGNGGSAPETASGCAEVRDEHEADRMGLQGEDPEAMRRVAGRIEDRPECFSTEEQRVAEDLRDHADQINQ